MAGHTAFARLAALLSLLALARAQVASNIAIYTDNALASPWQDWSWGSTIVYNATDLAEGASSISITSTAYSALSVYDPTPFTTMVGLEFDIAGANPDVSIYFNDVTDNIQSDSYPLSAFNDNVTADAFSHIVFNFNDIPPSGATLGNASWDRITFQAGGNGATYHIDNINLVSQIVIPPEFLSAEPMGNNLIAVTSQGAVDFQQVVVSLNGKTIRVLDSQTVSPVDAPSQTITYLTLATPLTPGALNIAAGTSLFNFTLPAQTTVSINKTITQTISPLIYGINWPTDASYIQDLGVTISRWGGNAVTAYNPFGDFTNAGNDWYFENRAADGVDANTWIGWVSAAGSGTYMTIPALDWVAKDTTSYSYSKTIYPDQESFDPYLADAGDGLFPNGSYITPVPPQTTAYTNWNTSAAKEWLSNLVNKPTIFTIDNEIEIASNTHQDMHPEPMGYDEELARVVNFSSVAKEVLPDVAVAAPSTCSWWYYWTSEIGYSDNAAHGNEDFLPWFLSQMAAAEKTAGKRLLDYLDLHYYFQADTSANDAAAQALRMRMTRSWWDPTYVDESWVGEDTPQNTQPNATIVQLIPRMHALIEEYYPGTKLSVSEWDSQADSDVTGGLVVADSLGIFGRYGLDSATYWSDPDETSAAALGYWLYRGYGMFFGDQSVQVNVPNFNPDLLGLYAATSSQDKKLSLVIVNKDPSNPVSLSLPDVPTGTYTIRHFGGLAGLSKWQTTIALEATSFVVVPAFTAVFLHQS